MKTLLVIDDEPRLLDTLEKLLTPEGYRVVLAKSAFEGIQQLEQQHIDLVICDWLMSTGNGYIIVDYIREEFTNPWLPIIIYSCYEAYFFPKETKNIKVDAYLSKFDQVEVLYNTIRSILR